MNLKLGNFGYTAGGWRLDKHPRLSGDVNGDGKADIVGFGKICYCIFDHFYDLDTISSQFNVASSFNTQLKT